MAQSKLLVEMRCMLEETQTANKVLSSVKNNVKWS